jgi:AhpD family alkylhydroperoxidase
MYNAPAVLSGLAHINEYSYIRNIEIIEASSMSKSYPEITKRISANLKILRKDIPDTMAGFSAMAQAATKDGALDKKTKELIALAIGVATRCDGCIGFHAEALVKLGATRAEVEEVLGMSIYMGGGPSAMYAADAIMAYDQYAELAAARDA